MPISKKKIAAILGVIIVGVIVFFFAAIKCGILNFEKKPQNASLGAANTTTATSALASTSNSSLTTSTIATQKSFNNGSFSFNYPATWNILNYWPLAIASFTTYNHGGIIPPEGAEIDMVTTTAEGGFSEIAKTELMGVSHVATSTTSISGASCLRADYINDYDNALVLKDTALYCAHGTEVWKIYFSYRSGDTTTTAHRADFEMVLKSLRFP